MLDRSCSDVPVAHAAAPGSTGRWLVGLLFVTIVLTGCRSGKFGSYVSPRVTGRVLDQKTHEPLADVKVVRITGGQTQTPPDQLKGAEALKQPLTVRTGVDGEFVLKSEKVLALFRHPSWYSVTVAFQRAGYGSWQTNYTIHDVSGHTAEGAPVVDAGSILLRRTSTGRIGDF